jgi:hypothetical protein
MSTCFITVENGKEFLKALRDLNDNDGKLEGA